MDAQIEKFIKYLYDTQPNLKDIIKSFQWCSRYNNGTDFLVNSQVKAIDFDRFSEWVRGCQVQSADSLCFNDDYAILIEFKSGDPTTHERKTQKLINNVIGKIDDSDDTLSLLYNQCFSENDARLKQKFFLVVDSKKMGVETLVSTLVGLSLVANNNPKQKVILEQVKPNLKQGIKNPEHYEDVDIWYSELFNSYLTLHRIKDIECPQEPNVVTPSAT